MALSNVMQPSSITWAEVALVVPPRVEIPFALQTRAAADLPSQIGIKHPISLAKAILDGSVKPLSLDRPPPNILVGQGAKDYAEKHRIAIVSNRSLTSKSSMERYLRLKHQLKKAEKAEKAEANSNQNSITVGGHGKAMNATGDGQHWNFSNSTLNGAGNQDQSEFPDTGYLHPVTAAASPGAHGNPLAHTAVDNAPPLSAPVWDGSVTAGGSEEHSADDFGTCEIDGVDATSDKEHGGPSCAEDHRTQLPGSIPDRDAVTDTVGAIAIDIHGNIAAGSSSGGIGMKLRGRLGPAALVGVGTAVVPQDPDDELATTVAAVTSGTGEQMATTLASGKCAERLYRSTRRGPGGQDIREEDEHVVLESFILHDFLGHPGVRSVPSPAAIGVMAVKKDRGSLYFYFAHNTDSFALATMSSLDREPLCVMSRRGDATEVAQGARKIRLQ
jgi:taspase (threonine aspartase 1)